MWGCHRSEPRAREDESLRIHLGKELGNRCSWTKRLCLLSLSALLSEQKLVRQSSAERRRIGPSVCSFFFFRGFYPGMFLESPFPVPDTSLVASRNATAVFPTCLTVLQELLVLAKWSRLLTCSRKMGSRWSIGFLISTCLEITWTAPLLKICYGISRVLEKNYERSLVLQSSDCSGSGSVPTHKPLVSLMSLPLLQVGHDF